MRTLDGSVFEIVLHNHSYQILSLDNLIDGSNSCFWVVFYILYSIILRNYNRADTASAIKDGLHIISYCPTLK